MAVVVTMSILDWLLCVLDSGHLGEVRQNQHQVKRLSQSERSFFWQCRAWRLSIRHRCVCSYEGVKEDTLSRCSMCGVLSVCRCFWCGRYLCMCLEVLLWVWENVCVVPQTEKSVHLKVSLCRVNSMWQPPDGSLVRSQTTHSWWNLKWGKDNW